MFVDLSSVEDPSLVVPTIGRVVGAAESPGEDPVAMVASALDAPLLLLDNLEQVLDAAPDVGRLLTLASDVTILATSRAPLRISGEHEYRVPPLAVPAIGTESVDDVERSAAARLYVERARRSVPDFAITEANAAAIARICRALEGLPLALELAAARVRLLGAEGTADRLGDMLGLLSRGARDLPERQRSLRATVDWSVRGLDDGARTVFAALGAFSGGGTLAAVEAVAGDGVDVPTALDDLLDAALVAPGPAFPSRGSRCSRRCASTRRSFSRPAPRPPCATATSTGSCTRPRARACTGAATPTPPGSSASRRTTTTIARL